MRSVLPLRVRLTPIQKRLMVVGWLATLVVVVARVGLVDTLFNSDRLHSEPITTGPFSAALDANKKCLVGENKTEFKPGEVVGWTVTFNDFMANTGIVGRLDLVDLKDGNIVDTETRVKPPDKDRTGSMSTCFSLRADLPPGQYAFERHGVLSPPTGSRVMEQFAPIYITVVP